MYIRPRRGISAGWTLIEMMIAMGTFAIVGLALFTIFMFCLRSYASVINYTSLDQENRSAMDQLTFEVRQAQKVINYSNGPTLSALTIINGNAQTVTYTFNSNRCNLVRTCSDGTTKTLLTNCTLLNFNLFTRPTITNSWDSYPIQNGNNWQTTVKVVQLSWRTAKTLLPSPLVESEDIQTARVVIRKQQD